jgi:hypothetical protein
MSNNKEKLSFSIIHGVSLLAYASVLVLSSQIKSKEKELFALFAGTISVGLIKTSADEYLTKKYQSEESKLKGK